MLELRETVQNTDLCFCP